MRIRVADQIRAFHASGYGNRDFFLSDLLAWTPLACQVAVRLRQKFDCVPQIVANFLQRVALGHRGEFLGVGHEAAAFGLRDFFKHPVRVISIPFLILDSYSKRRVQPNRLTSLET
jgi:hypothetical protein